MQFTRAESSGESEWMDVATLIQRTVVREFGFDDNAETLLKYRVAASKSDTPLQVRYNRAREGDLRLGDPVVDVKLRSLSNAEVGLASFTKPGRPLVVLSGSHS